MISCKNKLVLTILFNLNQDIIHPDTQDVLHKAGDVLSWDDFVRMLSLGIEKIDIEVAEEGVTV